MIWLPHENLSTSAQCLTDEHLLESIRDADDMRNMQMQPRLYGPQLKTLLGRMWRGYVDFLQQLNVVYEREAVMRGISTTKIRTPAVCLAPTWLGDERLHGSHRARLLFIEPSHYSKFNWLEKPKENAAWWP